MAVEKGSIPALLQEIQVQVVDIRGRERHMTEIITNWLEEVKATRGRNLPELSDPPVGFNAGPEGDIADPSWNDEPTGAGDSIDSSEGTSDLKGAQGFNGGDAMPSEAELEAKLAAEKAAQAATQQAAAEAEKKAAESTSAAAGDPTPAA